jgi:hypothetical protein
VSECLTLNVSFLKGLQPGDIRDNTLTWYRGDEKRGSVDFFAYAVGREPGQASVRLNYTYDSKPMQWEIELICIPSNLGKGKGFIWFFKCPVTGRKCRKLHFVDGRFVHRSALIGAFYELQTYSQRTILLKRLVDVCIVPYNVKKEMKGRYFKPTYNGNITRRHERLLQQIDRTRRITLEQVESLLP